MHSKADRYNELNRSSIGLRMSPTCIQISHKQYIAFLTYSVITAKHVESCDHFTEFPSSTMEFKIYVLCPDFILTVDTSNRYFIRKCPSAMF
jgi:hypothetical protein